MFKSLKLRIVNILLLILIVTYFLEAEQLSKPNPQTIEEVFAYMDSIFTTEEKSNIRKMNLDDIASIFDSRNSFIKTEAYKNGLLECVLNKRKNPVLVQNIGAETVHFEDYPYLIEQAYWYYINGKGNKWPLLLNSYSYWSTDFQDIIESYPECIEEQNSVFSFSYQYIIDEVLFYEDLQFFETKENNIAIYSLSRGWYYITDSDYKSFQETSQKEKQAFIDDLFYCKENE